MTGWFYYFIRFMVKSDYGYFYSCTGIALVNKWIIQKVLNKCHSLNLKEFRCVVISVYVKHTMIGIRGRPKTSVPNNGKLDICKKRWPFSNEEGKPFL